MITSLLPTDENLDLPLRRALQQSQIFGDLSNAMLSDLADSIEMKVFSGGDRVITQGDQADALLVVVSGRLLAIRRNEDGSSKRLSEIGPGSSVGEVGLILQQPRAADVLAIRDTQVALLKRSQFESLLKRHPVELNRAIARTIFEYSSIRQSPASTMGATAFTVVSLDSTVNTLAFCQQLTQALEKHGKVHHFLPQAGEQLHSDAGASIASVNYLNRLEQQFDFLLFQASDEATPWSHLAIRQADQVILLAGPETKIDTVAACRSLFSGAGFQMVRKSLVVLHPTDTAQPKVNLRWHERFELHRIYPLRLKNTADFARTARFLTDRAVGLVLGGGGARGFAHIGVLQALAEANIAVDMICGNSMGALIAAQYVNGTPFDKLLEQTQHFAKGGERLTIPIHSIFGGNRVRRDLIKMFADATVQSQWQQLFTVSCNLSHATIHVHDSGPLWEAVLASNSPAALVPPVIHKGDLLVDAALLDNVPVESMRRKLGFGTVIAVDVDVRDEIRVSPSIVRVNVWQLLWQRLFRRDNKSIPGIFDILNRSGHLGGLMRREASMTMADFYLQPPVSDFPLMGYSKGAKIVQTGYEYTKKRIENWKRSQNQQ